MLRMMSVSGEETRSKYKLTYYAFKGIAEPIRYIFAFASVDYEDVRIRPDANHYPKLPKSLKSGLPYGKLPVLEVDGKPLSESMVIAKFLGTEFGLAGKDAFEAAQCDELVSACQDFFRAGHAARLETDGVKKAALDKEMKEVTFPFYMSRFEKQVKQNGGKFFVGSTRTWADLCMFHAMDMIVERGAGPTAFDHFPALKAFAEGVRTEPKIAKWIVMRPPDEERAVVEVKPKSPVTLKSFLASNLENANKRE